MGIRLEYILVVTVVASVLITTSVTLTNGSNKKITLTKELEFENTTFTEVDKERMLSRSFSSYGVRDSGILTLNNLIYHTDNIELLLADKGMYKDNILYLDGNVSLEEKDGFHYTTEHANYNQKTQILNITSAFKAQMNKNIITGASLQYNALMKVVRATQPDAIVYTTKKK